MKLRLCRDDRVFFPPRRVPGGSRSAAALPGRLRFRAARVRLARTRRVQLGARLVRRDRGRASGPARAADRRRRRGHQSVVRRTVGPVRTGRQLAARPRRPARRPGAADARQRGAAVGGHPGRDEARGRDHPGVHAAAAGRSGGPDRARPGPARDHRYVPAGEVRRGTGRVDADRGRRRRRKARKARKAGTRTPTRSPLRPSSPRTASPGPTTHCCSTSPRAPQPSPSWPRTRRSATRWGTCPRCTGSASSQATCT